jgi:hypothetical protein
MRRAEQAGFDRFDARATFWFTRIFGIAVVVDVIQEVLAGVWGVHTGRFYPWRHIDAVPLYPATVLAIEWGIRVAAGIALLAGAAHVKVVAGAARVATLVLFVALLQRYSNHGVLLLLIAAFLGMGPPDVTAKGFATTAHPTLGLVRAQLVIVYVFSAINKLAHGFTDGRALSNLLGGAVPAGPARALAWMVIAAELLLPLLLMRWPRLGLALVVALHIVFSGLVPNTASFGLAMIAMAVLFARPRTR